MQSSQGMNNVDQLAALALALLLGKSSESKGGGNDDPWKMLVAMAMLSGMSGQGPSVSMSQNVSVAPDAYAAGTVTAGANVNLQGVAPIASRLLGRRGYAIEAVVASFARQGFEEVSGREKVRRRE